MPERFDYRRQLLRMVRGHLRGTPASRARADALLEACPQIKPFSVDAMLWSLWLAWLGDTVYQGDRAFLLEAERFLLGTPPRIWQGYFSSDVRSAMAPHAQVCYERLREALDFLEGISFPDIENKHVAIAEYERRRQDLHATLMDLAATGLDEPEMMHDLVLQEAAAIVLNINLGHSFFAQRFAPEQYMAIRPHRQQPNLLDTTATLQWARRAVNALAGEDWLYLSWRFVGKELRLSAALAAGRLCASRPAA